MEQKRVVPIVFVSSVVKSLELERASIEKLISSFGFDCDISGINETGFWGDTKSACLRLVEDCDLYIGLFYKRSGSLLFPEQIFVTEMEFYYALNTRRPMLIYILERPNVEPDVALSHFLHITKADRCVRTCRSTKDLIDQLKEDLETFSEYWSKGRTDLLVPPSLLDQSLRQIDVLSSEASLFGLSSSLVGARFDREFLIQQIAVMESYYRQDEFVRSAALGVDLMHAFVKSGISYRERDIVRLWSEFLKMWAGSCTWLGYVAGAFGAINASYLRKEAYRMLGDWSNFNEADELIGNSYYVLASRMKTVEAFSLNSPEGGDVSGHTHILKHALVYDERHARKTQSPFPHLHRAYINLELADYDRAIEDFKRMLRYGSRIGDRTYYDYLVSLGQSLVMKGLAEERQLLIREGRSLTDQAYGGLKQFNTSPFYLSYMKRIAKSYIKMGDIEAARSLLLRIYPLALKKKLAHQAEGISGLLASIEANNNRRTM